MANGVAYRNTLIVSMFQVTSGSRGSAKFQVHGKIDDVAPPNTVPTTSWEQFQQAHWWHVRGVRRHLFESAKCHRGTSGMCCPTFAAGNAKQWWAMKLLVGCVTSLIRVPSSILQAASAAAHATAEALGYAPAMVPEVACVGSSGSSTLSRAGCDAD